MRSYDKLVYERPNLIDELGPWVAYDIREGEGTWNHITDDWKSGFKHLIPFYVKDTSCAVQAGGHQGAYARLLSSTFDLVYTFEPHPVNFHCLVQNCQTPKIVKMQAALGSECGTIVLEEVSSSGQHRVMHGRHELYPIEIQNRYTVPVLTIDSLNLPSCGLIMLDTENFEVPIIEGALQTIEKFKPPIIVERNFLPENNQRVADMLAPFGYKLEANMGQDFLYITKP
jgi:FkbM family methyltransferase